MRRLALALIVALSLSTTAMAIDIAISTQAGWWPQGAATTEMQEIVDAVTGANITVFTPADLNALADWVVAHTGDGGEDLLIMCGIFPATIYPAGNAQADGSLAELFLDDGNTIINTGDYIFYVGSAGNNDAGGLANMMDVPAAAMWGDDSLSINFVPTADGQLYTPSLPTTQCNRPWIVSQYDGTDWYVELALAESSDGAQVMPGILRNAVTGGRVGAFFQVADRFTDIRGEVISEWINNWYLKQVSSPAIARDPSPIGGAIDVPRNTALSWTAGDYAVKHDVYFGTVEDDVNNATRNNPLGVLVAQGQTGTSYTPPTRLDFGETYYWRVDEVNGAPDNTIFKGSLWSFTTELFVYPIQGVAATSNTTSEAGKGPERLVDGSGLNANDQHNTNTANMWGGTPNPTEPSYVQFDFDTVYKLHEMMVWNYNMEFEMFLGLGVKTATIEYTENGTDWTVLGDFDFGRGPGSATYAANTTIAFGGVAASAVRLTILSNFSNTQTMYGLSEVRFLHIPVNASEPQPAVGAVDVPVATTLSWRPGREAASHEVYLGTDPNALPLAGTSVQSAYTPAALDLNATYSWQIVEVNNAEAVSAWTGPIWNFTTQAYLVVEDFESYTDDWEAGEAIWQTWIDGWEDNANGSQVGYATSPFAEQTIVNSGKQSMPMFFDNTSASAISEATLTLSPAQNWTTSGVQSLSLWYHGAEDNTGQLYVKINNGAPILYDGPAVNIARPAWQLWSIDLSQHGNVSNVTALTVGVKGTGSGVVYVDDIRLYPEVLEYLSLDITGPGDIVQGVPNDGPNTASNTEGWPPNEAPGFVIDDNTGTKFLHFKGEVEPTGVRITPLVGATVVTEVTFTTANDSPERDPVTWELYGSNASIDGPYTLIASGNIVDFAGTAAWERQTKTATPITFNNTVAYTHYQVMFPTVRNAAAANSMQISEIELIGQ